MPHRCLSSAHATDLGLFCRTIDDDDDVDDGDDSNDLLIKHLPHEESTLILIPPFPIGEARGNIHTADGKGVLQIPGRNCLVNSFVNAFLKPKQDD